MCLGVWSVCRSPAVPCRAAPSLQQPPHIYDVVGGASASFWYVHLTVDCCVLCACKQGSAITIFKIFCSIWAPLPVLLLFIFASLFFLPLLFGFLSHTVSNSVDNTGSLKQQCMGHEKDSGSAAVSSIVV